MLLQKEFVHQLKDFGLNSYESKLWAALLSRGAATAGELSDIANVPRSRSYDVLESLEKKGFLIVKIGKPIRYMAVPPEHVVDRVRKRIAEEAEEKVAVISKIEKSSLLEELKALHNSGIETIDPLELSGTLKGRKNIYSRIDFAIKNAQKEVIISTTAEGLKRKSEIFRNSLKKANSKGVKIRIAAPLSDAKDSAAELSEFAELRTTNAEARYFIIDAKQVFFMLAKKTESPSLDAAIWINSPFLAASFKALFDKSWAGLKALSR
ncbi:TrmB family transcriptional regulator [Candidatus Woesearchaeota archaeon]|nr:TrmB family transcriptional regulator [Candidatus Woesearchaeota archaeon]